MIKILYKESDEMSVCQTNTVEASAVDTTHLALAEYNWYKD